MRRILFCVLIGIMTSAPLARAVDPSNDIANLSTLSRHNQLPQLIQEANALLANDQLTTVQRSTVLTYLGHAYQENGDFHSATGYYEKALAILDRDTVHTADYATSLAALATLYAESGQTSTAKHLLTRSMHILEQEGGHQAEIAIFWNDLAVIAAQEHSLHEARKCIAHAFAELQSATNVSSDTIEALTTTKARIAEMDGDFPAAIAGYKQSLALWTKSHGEQHPETAMLYVLLGGAYLGLGDIASAREMTSRGLTLMEATSDHHSTRYLAAELVYSRVLDASGSHDEASKFRKEAQAGMTAASSRSQGEISVSALR